MSHDTIYEAVRAAVERLGSKRVAASLWPPRADDLPAATRYLMHCLDPDRAEKLSLDELVMIMQQAARAGVHDVADYLAAACLYEVRPILPAQAQAELAQQLDRTVSQMAALLDRYERLRKVATP